MVRPRTPTAIAVATHSLLLLLFYCFFPCIVFTAADSTSSSSSSIAQPQDPSTLSLSHAAFPSPGTGNNNSNTTNSSSSTEAAAASDSDLTAMPAWRRRDLRRAELAEKLLQGEGLPKAPPPFAWCSSSRMTAAIPVTHDPLSEGWPRGGFRNHTNDPRCRATFVEEFFGDGLGSNESMRDSRRHALMASVAYGECGTRRSETGKYVYHSNVMRVPGAENNAVVTCACAKTNGTTNDTTAKGRGNGTHGEGEGEGDGEGGGNATSAMGGECVATAKWEHTSGSKVAHKSKELLTREWTAIGSGHLLSAEVVAGPNLTLSVNNKDDGFVFESWIAGSPGHPWPMLCDLVCPDGPSEANPGCVHHLIVNGCPADRLRHATSNNTPPLFTVISQSRGHIVFSLRPASFPKGNSKDKDKGKGEGKDVRYNYRVQCMMAVFPRQPSVDEQCELGRKYGQWRRRRLQEGGQSHGGHTPSAERGSWGDDGHNGGEGSKPAVSPGMVGEVEGQIVSPPISLNPLQPFPFNANTPEDLFSEIANEIIWDNWSINWGRDFLNRETSVQVGNDVAFVGIGIDTLVREQLVNVGYGKTTVTVSTDEQDLEGGVGVMVGSYGVRVDADLDDRQYAIEAVARGTEVGANIDKLDRDYGVRVKVRSTEVTVRHDFFDVQDISTNDDEELATEVFVGYKSTGVAIGSDVDDTEYGVSVGTLGYQFSVLRDFDERQTDFQGNWGDGYQLVLNGDFPDPADTEVFVQVGFGVLGTTYVQVGAGVGGDGIPQGSAEVETDDVSFGVDFIDDLGERFFLFGLTVGKFTYTWESEVIPDNLQIPLILGALG
ncbi:unnamed protein product [Vitrella brassicaformis CCMP3155]|uniref:Bacterial repeat domain-containing protein n=2 Tax=Vitrella brassicaformis TaxID=1169539 RepID=A0A0G4EHH8_VITBC|nr:unnamed protein product [Vitrella brassicaformis CCMP3155]|eukprot:CEL95635.1 unnamed protein product [Vitrella brassicaformis CCMP3155]